MPKRINTDSLLAIAEWIAADTAKRPKAPCSLHKLREFIAAFLHIGEFEALKVTLLLWSLQWISLDSLLRVEVNKDIPAPTEANLAAWDRHKLWDQYIAAQGSPDDAKVLEFTDVPCGAPDYKVTCTACGAAADAWVAENLAPIMSKGIGLDVEWRPTRTKGGTTRPAIVQIGVNDQVLILNLLKLPRAALPVALVQILEDPDVLKGGVGLVEDARLLHRTLGVNIQGCVDASDVAVAQGFLPDGKTAWGLASLVEATVGWTSWKNKRVIMSNWEAWPLSRAQAAYASMDAVASAAVIYNLEERFGRDVLLEGRSPLKALTMPPLKSVQHLMKSTGNRWANTLVNGDALPETLSGLKSLKRRARRVKDKKAEKRAKVREAKAAAKISAAKQAADEPSDGAGAAAAPPTPSPAAAAIDAAES